MTEVVPRENRTLVPHPLMDPSDRDHPFKMLGILHITTGDRKRPSRTNDAEESSSGATSEVVLPIDWSPSHSEFDPYYSLSLTTLSFALPF